MAAVNGVANQVEDREDSVLLGKRKRSASPQKRGLVNGEDVKSLQESLKIVLSQSKK
jgi:hypothetical protein